MCKGETMNEDGYKEVYFDQYCKSCKHHEKKDTDEPCNECLENPINQFSHKPVKWEAGKTTK